MTQATLEIKSNMNLSTATQERSAELQIVIAESNEVHQQRLLKTVEALGKWTIHTCSEYAELIDTLSAGEIDLLILGNVKNGSCFEICRLCRREWDYLPIILVTHDVVVSNSYRQWISERGFGHVVSSAPNNHDNLVRVIQSITGVIKAQKQAPHFAVPRPNDTEPLQNQPAPSVGKGGRNNNYTFFNFNTKAGEITDSNQRRNIIAGEDFIVSLLKGLEHGASESAESVETLLYLIGQNWGKQDAIAFDDWFKQHHSMTSQIANLALAMETWWWSLTAQGWGSWSLNLSYLNQGFIFADLFDSAIAKTLGQIGKPACHLYAGLLSGFFSTVFGKNLGCIEVECQAMGHKSCRFLIGSEERIRATEAWISSGATLTEVESLFQSQETTIFERLTVNA